MDEAGVSARECELELEADCGLDLSLNVGEGSEPCRYRCFRVKDCVLAVRTLLRVGLRDEVLVALVGSLSSSSLMVAS